MGDSWRIKQELSPNLCALPYVKELMARSEQLKIKVQQTQDVTVIDCGVEAPGSWEAGKIFANICLGGLAQVKLHWGDFNGLRWQAVEVSTDYPVLACMASQYAGWQVKTAKYSAMGSGPARALVHAEELFARLSYQDSAETAVLCLEGRKLPPADALNWIVEKCGLKAQNVYILIAPSASPVGSVQIAARSVETGLHKMLELGYDLDLVESGWGIAPLPPPAKNDIEALGRTNDAILYGTTVQYNVRDEDEKLKALIGKIPSESSRDYGQPFFDLFTRYGNFYDIDPLLFSPAEVWLTNLNSGITFQAGRIRADLLKESFKLN